LLVLLFGITYLDRVCISVAGPLMQRDLHIGPVGWGWVTGMFTVSYCLFEITFQQSGVFGVCLDIGKKHAGAMVGLMNASAQVGGLVGAVAYGYIVEHFGNYDAPFVPMAALLFLGALLWLKVDASEELHVASNATPHGVVHP
jgi:predicted MFS family arabinose efflux permease